MLNIPTYRLLIEKIRNADDEDNDFYFIEYDEVLENHPILFASSIN